MSLVTQVNNLATVIGGKVKDLYAKVTANTTAIGTLANLTTTAKGDVVSAINEVNAKPTTSGGAAINDSAPSTTTAYSSSKTDSQISYAIANLVSTAPSTMDTLGEIAAQLASDESAAAALTTSVGYRVRFDAAQSLTAPQQLQACSNIGIGDPTTDFVATFNAALV